MEHKVYTTVEEMNNKVNELYELLDQAKKLADTLVTKNARNGFRLRYEPELVEEERPISIKERVEEAKKHEILFGEVRGMINRVVAKIARNY